MVITEEDRKVSRLKLLILILGMITGISLPVYGKESSLNGQGHIKGFEEQICNMRVDYLYLEGELAKLLEECN